MGLTPNEDQGSAPPKRPRPRRRPKPELTALPWWWPQGPAMKVAVAGVCAAVLSEVVGRHKANLAAFFFSSLLAMYWIEFSMRSYRDGAPRKKYLPKSLNFLVQALVVTGIAAAYPVALLIVDFFFWWAVPYWYDLWQPITDLVGQVLPGMGAYKHELHRRGMDDRVTYILHGYAAVTLISMAGLFWQAWNWRYLVGEIKKVNETRSTSYLMRYVCIIPVGVVFFGFIAYSLDISTYLFGYSPRWKIAPSVADLLLWAIMKGIGQNFFVFGAFVGAIAVTEILLERALRRWREWRAPSNDSA